MNPLFIVALALSVAFIGAENSKDACQTLIKCLNDALSERKRCDNITQTINAKWPPKLNEHDASIANKRNKNTEYDFVKRSTKIKCLEDSLGNTTVTSCDQPTIKTCSERVANYSAPRARRQVAATTAAPRTTRTTTQSPAQIKAAEEKAAAAAKAAAEKKEKDQLNQEKTDCLNHASKIDTTCTALASCCSESGLCDLKFQQNPVFAEIAKLQYDLQIESRRVSCPAPATPAPPVAPPPAGGR